MFSQNHSRPTWQCFATHFWVATHSFRNAALENIIFNFIKLYIIVQKYNMYGDVVRQSIHVLGLFGLQDNACE